MCVKTLVLLLLVSFLSCKAGSDSPMVFTDAGYKSEMVKNENGTFDFKPILGDGPTDIKITLSDLPNSGLCRIVGFYSDQNYIADTLQAINGVIHYKNPKGLAQGFYYFGVPGKPNDYIQVMVGEDQQFEMTCRFTDVINSMVINGSDENTMFYEFSKFENGISGRLQGIANKMTGLSDGSPEYKKLKAEKEQTEGEKLTKIKEIYQKNPKSLFANFKFGGQNPKLRDDLPNEAQVPQYRKEFWDNVNFSDPRLLRTPMIGNKTKKYFKELTPQNPDSIFQAAKMLMDKVLDKPEYFKILANWVVLTYEPTKCELMDAEAVFVKMVQSYFTKEKAHWQDSLTTSVIQKRAFEMAQSLVGLKAPNVISTDQYGKKQELLSKTADYLIVYMFNPDCEHCQEETPKLHQYYLENKGVVDVFAIGIETDDAKWKNYIAKNNLQWTNVFDPTNKSIYGKYFVDITPEIYVINKERKIIGKNLKSFQVPTIIDKDRASKK